MEEVKAEKEEPTGRRRGHTHRQGERDLACAERRLLLLLLLLFVMQKKKEKKKEAKGFCL